MALLVGCHRTPLEVRSEYLIPEYLASVQAKTPDPCRTCYVGRQIVVQWRLPKRCLTRPLNLLLTVRYGNGQEATFTYPVTRRSGWWVHRLVNEQYWYYDDIATFKVELWQGEHRLDLWTQHVWADMIVIPHTD